MSAFTDFINQQAKETQNNRIHYLYKITNKIIYGNRNIWNNKAGGRKPN